MAWCLAGPATPWQRSGGRVSAPPSTSLPLSVSPPAIARRTYPLSRRPQRRIRPRIRLKLLRPALSPVPTETPGAPDRYSNLAIGRGENGLLRAHFLREPLSNAGADTCLLRCG